MLVTYDDFEERQAEQRAIDVTDSMVAPTVEDAAEVVQ